MRNRLVIIGAGGHGKVVADIALKNGYTDIFFADDTTTGKCMDFPIICKISQLADFANDKTDFIIAIGNNEVRKKIAEQYNLNWVTLIHPSAQIGINVEIGVGTVVMANATVNPCSSVGKHCIINTSSVIEHDNVIGDYVHISPKVAIGGTVRIGDGTHIGIGASVKNNTMICNDCVIGVGTVVVKNIDEVGVYVGVPSRKIK